MTRRTTYLSLTSILMLVLILAPVYGQATSVPSDDAVKARLNFIQTALDAGQGRARTWYYGWLGASAAATAVQWGITIADSKDLKPVSDSVSDKVNSDRKFAQDMLVGGVTTALAFGGWLLDPFVPAYASGKLKALPESTPEERQAKLQKAEELLRQCAHREEEGQGLVTHLLNLGVNAAAGIVTAAAFERPWTDGLIAFAEGEAFSLITIYTQPRRAIRDLKNYEVTYLGAKGEPLPAPSETNFSVGLFPGGLHLSLSW